MPFLPSIKVHLKYYFSQEVFINFMIELVDIYVIVAYKSMLNVP